MATSKNPITGDSIQTKIGDQHAYSNGWDRIFGKGSLADVMSQQEQQEETTYSGDLKHRVARDHMGRVIDEV